MTHAIMVLGTASHVGKSLIATALCRILADDGHRVAPFKAQNMSLDSAATPDGREIGRAQALQAEAARIAPSVDMNPLLLKPSSDTASQIVLLGRVAGVQEAADWHRDRVARFFPVILDAYRRLASLYDIIVIEGAGSPAEINLKASDIVNMRVAEATDAACVLVGDIDRGGVFASLLGTMELLEPHERVRIRGFAINKFRGDPALLAPGIVEIESRLGIPSLGVVPWLRDVGLDEEDGVALDDAPRVSQRPWGRVASDCKRALRVAVVAFPFLSNATDFAALAAEPSVDLAYALRPRDLAHADVVILPGTKDTLGALRWLAGGMGAAIVEFAGRGMVVGICGGYQALGLEVADPHGVEGGGSLPGLGLLPVQTVLGTDKITRPVRVRLDDDALFSTATATTATATSAPSVTGSGYEIHMGRTVHREPLRAFTHLSVDDDAPIEDGAVSHDGAIVGTYVHGLFGDDVLRAAFVRAARARAGLTPATAFVAYTAEREARIDRLAAHVRAALDIDALLGSASRA